MSSRRGGKRVGAGRKPVGEQPKTATIAIRVSPEIKQLAQAQAQQQGISVSQMVEDLIIEKAGI